MLQQITIPVDAETAQLYERADAATRQKVAFGVLLALRDPMHSREQAIEQLLDMSRALSERLSEEEKQELEAELARIS